MTRYRRRSTPATNPTYDPLGNPHSGDCLCDHCGPSEYALAVQAERERYADEQARIARSIARSKALREFDQTHFPEQVAEDDERGGLMHRKVFLKSSFTDEDQQRLDYLLARLKDRKKV